MAVETHRGGCRLFQVAWVDRCMQKLLLLIIVYKTGNLLLYEIMVLKNSRFENQFIEWTSYENIVIRKFYNIAFVGYIIFT